MAARKSGLGKGLDSLIPNKIEQTKAAGEEAPVSEDGSKSSRAAGNTGSTGKNTSGTKKATGTKKTTGSSASSAAKKAAKKISAADTAAEKEEENIRFVPIGQVEPNREQPRKQFDPDALQELADSIRIHGVLQPLLVSDKDDYYEIIAGERRWRAAKIAGLGEIPVIVKELTESEIVEISLIENIQREDLNPIEEARAYDRLLTEFHLKQEDIAQRVSKSRSAVTNSLRLLRLHPDVQGMLIRAELYAGHARALLAVEDSDRQLELAQKAVMEHLSVREVEKLVKNTTAEKKPPKQPDRNPVLDAIYRDIAEDMSGILGTRVEILPNKGKKQDTGKIEIEYYSQDELNRILELFRTIENE